MVNTFLTDFDFKVSAKKLDSRRLGKQRVEAYQILNIIEDLHFVSQHLNIPSTQPKEWIKQIISTYRSLDYYFAKINDKYIQVNKSIKKYKSKDIKLEGNLVVTSDGTFERDQVLFEGDRLVKFGFGFHPCVRMWIFHPDSLKNYIQAHIDEWIERGYKNTMKEYLITDCQKPKWCSDPQVIENHREALMRKELERYEEPWYILQSEFNDYVDKIETNFDKKHEYIWY